MLRPQLVLVDLAITVLSGAGGVGGAWWLRRRTSLSVANLYPLAVTALTATAAAIAVRWWIAVLVLLPVAGPCLAGAAAGWRWRTAELGAGEELRNHELAPDGSGNPPPNGVRASACTCVGRANWSESARGPAAWRSCR